MDENKILTAVEARTLVQKSTTLRNRIYKFINEEAREGRTTLEYGLTYEDFNLRQSLIADLRSNGYTVDLIIEEPFDSGFAMMKISWAE